ncbi:hypothetical protein [Clostridium folliculivorans]|uniref:Uncharacterized protein n=1 Tax=Clostridium folliculivorans TaxID=2886038 RepID=A0A9W5Y3U9_9CLOT|nr:hypothetical protein [Clostridium folliculivorans]GKU26050.1 hypothetical protein CFOLD11_28770 [Clostridium folliculivorans]GKU28136.1 hypothetical protein CFB3_02420 [Clostridium folliculivorans]
MDLKDIISDIMDNITDSEDFRGISSSFKKYKQLVTTGMSEGYAADSKYSQDVNNKTNVENNVVQRDSYGEILKSNEVDINPIEGEKGQITGISGEITPSKLKEAIILSEIINKPVCKRSRRGFRRV